MAVKRRRDSPDPAVPIPKLGLLFGRILMQAIRRVGDDSMDAAIRLPLKPIKAIGMNHRRPTAGKRLFPCLELAEFLLIYGKARP